MDMEGESEHLHQHFQEKTQAGYHSSQCEINPYEDVDEDALQIRQLYERINRLGLVDRSIILMWLENLSYEEIGAILGISVKNVSVKLVRIREKLKQMSNPK